jgi:hypothetical protein
MDAIIARDRDYPLDNARFLGALVDDVRATTGRLYGATTYARLLRDLSAMTGVARRPSTTTIQKAVTRAQALAPVPALAQSGLAGEAGDAHTLRRMLEPVLRDTVAPLFAQVAASVAGQREGASPPAIDREPTLRLQLTQAALEDAHARIRSTDDENARLRRELGEAQAARDLAGQHVNQMLAELHQAITASGMGAQALAQAARRLEGTEQFLKGQNDAVRLQATGEADGLRRLVAQLRDQISQLQIENDQYRRALATHPGRHGSSR